MDVQAANLLATLRRPSAPPEQKLTLLSNLKSDIKHYRVPDQAQGAIFECLKIAISQQTSINIVTAALSTLGHLVKRLKIQDPDGRAITLHAPRLFATLQDRLGDSRDSHRTSAMQAFADLYPFCPTDIEHIIREECIAGTHARCKEMGMQWVVKMHEEQSLPFKTFVPVMVACLEDADGTTRDAAKSALVDLFRTASTPAKNDLKKQLKLHMVRQSIATQILAQIGLSDRPERPQPDNDFAASTRSLPAFDHASQFAESINTEAAKPPVHEEVQMDPIFVQSQRELEDIFRDMAPHFEGKESEENWMLRDKDVTKLRKLLKGNAPSEFHSAFMSGLKQLQEGTLKAANTLRTTLMTNGCNLVQELARNLGPAMEPMVESYLQNFIKMCANTKNIAAQNGTQTVDTIFQYVSYNSRHMQHIWLAIQDKNKQPRVCAAGWLRTILDRQAGSKTQFEHTGGLDLAEKTIKKGLTDADPKVKESMRATYWAFASSWPDKADSIMNSLDDKAKLALERDSHNPNANKAAFSASTASRTSGARSALRDRIAAAKKATQAQPGRPLTAMATMTPAKSKSMANLNARAKVMGPPSATRVASNASVMSAATSNSMASSTTATSGRPISLMSGAARRPMKRVEIARPATADPYANRTTLRPETPTHNSKSPTRSPAQSSASKQSATQSTIARNRIGRLGSPAASPLRNPRLAKSPAGTRPLSRDALDALDHSNRSKGDDFTMVLPSVVHQETASSAAKRRADHDATQTLDMTMQGLGLEDNFTLVLPSALSSNNVGHEATDAPTPHRHFQRAQSAEASSIPVPRGSRISLNPSSPPVHNNSPKAAKLASPRGLTPDRRDTPQPEPPVNPRSRQGSPLKTFSAPAEQEEEVRIYEDPFTASISEAPAEVGAPSVLTELPVNNQSPPTGADEMPTNGVLPTHNEDPLSPPLSPQSKAEKMRSRKLLQSGIQRIRARTLDTHGYRKVLELTRTVDPTDLFGNSEDSQPPRLYTDLFLSLCEFLSTTPGATPIIPDRPLRPAAEVKRQAFALLRGLLRSASPLLQSWTSSSSSALVVRALSAALESRRFISDPGLPAKDAEQVAGDCIALAPARSSRAAIASFIEARVNAAPDAAFSFPEPVGPADADPSAKATALALRALRDVLRLPTSDDMEVPAVMAKVLRAVDAETRKAAVEVAVELYRSWDQGDKDGFWKVLDKQGELPEGMKNLVVYFVARREGSVGPNGDA